MSAMNELLPVALRDTALTIAELHGENKPSAEAVLADAKNQIEQLGAELQMRGLSPDVIEDAQYAQCALIDETAMRCLAGDERHNWELHPLQLGKFERNDAGEEVVRRMQRWMGQARTERLLLAIFGAVLDLGFMGRFALEGEEARAKFRRSIDQRLGVSHKHESEDDESIVIKADVVRPWTSRISPLTCMALACVATGLAWFAINGWLDASVARMTH
ncbi:DotU family type IV/VI secretion system protein [Caballeronia sp. LZ025]|uniref:DotU family type IV/VI secretion system protein n=1 Tax=Caballeronia TaxID=1827195 RepID=UPI001FD1FAFA|nr:MULTISPECIES: DotU family type IV/VI secretion system protein [Caballeronia]MDR5735845.1 DotU family type IV/VI secretion system protein [Caballeronia sp. LZ025]